MRLSVCLLTRNQEDQIGAALRSVAGVVHECVVIDTGSADRTVAVAAEFGAKVIPFPWEDDFAAGRNFAVENATGDWLLWLNADEELAAESQALLRQSMEQPKVFGYFVRVQHVPSTAEPKRVSEMQDVRLFVRRPDLRFVGRLHPVHSPKSVETIRSEGLGIVVSDVILRSHARPWEADESKLRWMLRLIELELADRPGQLHYLIEKGRVLLRLADPKGHEAMAEAVERIIPLQAADKPPASNVQILLEYLMTVPPGTSRSRLTGAKARELARRWFPSSPALLYRLAEQDFKDGQFAAAAATLERLIHLGRTGAYDRSRSFDRSLVGEDAMINLAACYERLGRLEEAERCYQSLLGNKSYDAQARDRLGKVRHSRRGR